MGRSKKIISPIAKSSTSKFIIIMKKTLLFGAALCMAAAVNAQTESAFIDAAALGITTENTDVAAGTVLCTSTNVTMKAAYGIQYKTVAMSGESDKFKSVTIDGVNYGLVTGIQGQTNPTNTKCASTQQPTAGAIFQFDVKADGVLYVFSKLSANKQYYAFEGAYSAETPSSSIGYTIVGGGQADGKTYSAVHPADADGYANFSGYPTAETIGTYFLCDLLGIRPTTDETYGTNTFNDDNFKQTILGVAAFPVYAEAETYYYFAVGSKVTCDGFVFIPGAKTVANIEISETQGTTSISNVAAASQNAAVYNLLGQRVAADTKGLVIINGKKVIRK